MIVPPFDEIVQNFRFADAMDLAVATALFTLLFHWLRKRSNQALLLVVLGMVSLYFISHWLRMYLTLALYRMGLTVAVIGIIIIFQNDLRYAFERLAAWHPFTRRNTAPPHQALILTLVEGVALLANENMGALIVLPGRQNLERHLRGGEKLRGEISVPLLHSLFHSESRGHDGAVVLREKYVERFGVHLPLSTNFPALGPGGTRHAAALGLAEQSDALVIVVSEERGVISVAQNGELQPIAHIAELKNRLEKFYQQGRQPEPRSHWIGFFALQLLVLSLGFLAAFLMWLLFAFQVDSVQRVVDQVPVESHDLPDDWVVESISPQHVRVNVVGSERAFAAFDWSTLRVKLDLSDPVNGQQTMIVGEEAIELPEEISLVRADPGVLRVTAYKTRTVELPVEVKTDGQLPDDRELMSQEPSPETITVKVQESLRAQINSIPTRSIDLSEIRSSTRQEAQLVFPDGVWPVKETPSMVEVNFRVREREEESPDQ